MNYKMSLSFNMCLLVVLFYGAELFKKKEKIRRLATK